MSQRPVISIVTPCYNEEENVGELYRQVKAVFNSLPAYDYEHIFIDNASRDRTVQVLEEISQADRNVKIIVNNRNFGPVRSPFYGLLQANGNAVILLVADLQDPPEMIRSFVENWENGAKVVMGVKTSSEESRLMFAVRKLYYNIVTLVSEIELTKNYTGFGLYDQVVIEHLRKLSDPYPYFRGLISYLGFETAKIVYRQPVRKKGVTKYNFYALYDTAMLGLVSHSKAPLRVLAMLGFSMAILSFMLAVFHILLKIFFWKEIPVGFSSIITAIFFFSSVQLFFIGILGEYILSIHAHILKRPLVIEKKRINFS